MMVRLARRSAMTVAIMLEGKDKFKYRRSNCSSVACQCIVAQTH